VTAYLHLRSGSVTVSEGDEVSCGDPLGRIGSSGRSAMPHLHLQLTDPGGATADPYVAPDDGRASLWTTQDAGDGLPGEACAPAWTR